MSELNLDSSAALVSKQFKVLFVINTLPPHDLSGAGEQVVQLAGGLSALGVETEILGRGAKGARGPKVLFPLTVVWPALLRLRSGAFDVVQVHESDGGMLAFCLRLARMPGLRWLVPPVRLVALLQVTYDEEARAVRPLVDSTHGVVARPVSYEKRFKWLRTPLQRLLGRWSARFADTILVPSAQTGREVARDYGIQQDGEKGPKVLPNATSATTPVSPRDPEAGALLFVGRLRIRKGVEVLLYALAELERRGVKTTLTVAGDGERREVLEELCRSLSLDDCVEFLGHCDQDKLRAHLERSEALVVPSTYEGMPLVILEAMDASVPVVASAVSGIPEVVLDGETGWLVPPEDVELLSDALQELLQDPGERDRRGEAGRSRLELFRPDRVAATWLEHVEHVQRGNR